MQIITRTEDLAKLCDRLRQAPYVTVDTEFHRETTYWPELCLIQMAAEGVEVIIDPLSPELDLSPFFQLMGEEGVVKVFHAARQDIEIIHHLSGAIPHPLFDTQVAAMVCGFGEAISYGMLVKRLLGENLDKSSRFTDWRQRPLSADQLAYALGDVTHLRGIYQELRKRLQHNGRAEWLAEEMDTLTDPATYDLKPEDAWQRLKLRVTSPKALAVMQELAAWRERAAQAKNLPRRRILNDDALYDIANRAPRTTAELAALRSVSQKLAKSSRGEEILAAVARGLARNSEDLPPLPQRQRPSATTQAVMDLLRVWLKAAAARHGVAAKLIATAEDLEKIATQDNPDVPAMHGWRRKLFGEDALALKAGKLALGLEKGRVALVPPAQIAQPARTEADD